MQERHPRRLRKGAEKIYVLATMITRVHDSWKTYAVVTCTLLSSPPIFAAPKKSAELSRLCITRASCILHRAILRIQILKFTKFNQHSRILSLLCKRGEILFTVSLFFSSFLSFVVPFFSSSFFFLLFRSLLMSLDQFNFFLWLLLLSLLFKSWTASSPRFSA